MAQDKVLLCVDCKKEFTHTVADQKQFAERGFSWEPKRCPDCRKARKERNAARPRGNTGPGGIGPVDEKSWGGGGRSYDRGGGFRGPRGEGRGGRRGDDEEFSVPRQSYDAVCAQCGQKTTVPFEPTQGRDVYCRDCFQKRKAAGQ